MNNRSLKVYLYYCSSNPDMSEQVLQYSGHKDELKAIPLPCSGKMDILYLTKAFETGADGVAILTCQQDDCRYLEGDLRAKKRAEAVDALLEETGLGKGRISVIQMKDGGMEQVLQEVEDFLNRIRVLTGRAPGAGIRAPAA